MIIGGLQTGNTKWLAAHLQNTADNQTIELAEISGTIAVDIDGALAEFDAYTRGTRAKEGVYAAFINPPEKLTREQYFRAIDVIEQRLGLTGQPRIVLFHEKAGREHCHIAWSRIDTEAMKAIPLSHDRQKLRRCAQELAAEFGTELPPGLAEDRGAERFKEPPQPTRAEKAMEASSGLSREERRSLITACYKCADSSLSFVNALEAAGFLLARGDRRAYVVVDLAGDVHSLARQIDGARTRDVKKLLAQLPLSVLPPVERARILMAQRAAAQRDAVRAQTKKQHEARAAHEQLKLVQKKRRAALDLLWQAMKTRQMHEWKVLLAHIKAEKERHIARRHWLATGLALYLKKIAVMRQLIEYYEKRRMRSVEEQNRALEASMRRRHENEAAELRRRYAALSRLDRLEWRTFDQSFGAFAGEEDRLAGIADYRSSAAYLLPRTDLTVHCHDPGRFTYNTGVARQLYALEAAALSTRYGALVQENAADITTPTGEPFWAQLAQAGAHYDISPTWNAFYENAVEITGGAPGDSALRDDTSAGDAPVPPAAPRFLPSGPGA